MCRELEFLTSGRSELRPELSVTTVVVDGDQVASELSEHLVIDGVVRVDQIAGFCRVQSGALPPRSSTGKAPPTSRSHNAQSPLEVELPAKRHRPSFLPALRLTSQPCAPDVKCNTRSSDKGRSHGE